MIPYIGEIRMFPGLFAPSGWLYCSGQLLTIADYTPLYNLIRTTYGGDGQTNFALPDMRGRVPVYASASTPFAAPGGSESVTLSAQQTASHNHGFATNNGAATAGSPAGNVLAQSGSLTIYSGAAPSVAMGGSSITNSSGGGQPHANIQPYLCVNFIIATEGIYPSQN